MTPLATQAHPGTRFTQRLSRPDICGSPLLRVSQILEGLVRNLLVDYPNPHQLSCQGTKGLQSAAERHAQCEVLKEPQALFFGKNGAGGLINVRSNDPTDEAEDLNRLDNMEQLSL